MNNFIDENGKKVSAFTSKVQNLSRIGELADAFVDMAESGAWRDYTFATGHFRFRAAEFDYFLIANSVRRDDAARVLAYNKRSKELAPLMDRDADRRKRRPFEQAASEYQAVDSLNTDLVAAGIELGWINGEKFADVESTSEGANIPIRSALPEWTRAGRAERSTRWHVYCTTDRPLADAIADKLLADPELAYEVWKKLQANQMRITRDKQKRRSA